MYGISAHNSTIHEDVECLIRSIMIQRKSEGLPPLRAKEYLKIFTQYRKNRYTVGYITAFNEIFKGCPPESEIDIDLDTGYFMRQSSDHSKGIYELII
jgi:hypothetical protein